MSSSIEFISAVATTTGQVVTDSFPILYLILGSFVGVALAGMLVGAFNYALRTITKGRRRG